MDSLDELLIEILCDKILYISDCYHCDWPSINLSRLIDDAGFNYKDGIPAAFTDRFVGTAFWTSYTQT
jgi:hypothetical protein